MWHVEVDADSSLTFSTGLDRQWLSRPQVKPTSILCLRSVDYALTTMSCSNIYWVTYTTPVKSLHAKY